MPATTQKNKLTLPQVDGVLVLNKPSGPSSAACVGIIKRKLGQQKIGHAGTLDPMATGVLLILLGQATKISGYLLQGGQKVYSGIIELGTVTDTWDAKGEVLEKHDFSSITHDQVLSEVQSWLGTSEQKVPPYSAAKHKGKPLYELARKGLEVPEKVKTIEISRAELEWFKPPLAHFRVACSSGTYIRSLAHSLGIRLGCGAMLAELTREYSHPYALEQAVNLDELVANPELLPAKVHSISSALPHLPSVILAPELARCIKNGNALPRAALPPMDSATVIALEETKANLALLEKAVVKGTEVWAIGRGLWNNN